MNLLTARDRWLSRLDSLVGTLSDGVDRAARADASDCPHPLRVWIRASLVGVVASVVLLGYRTETQPQFYALLGLSVVVYLIARGEVLAAVVLQYLSSRQMAWRWAFVVWAILSLLWTSRSGYSIDRAITILEVQALGLIFFDASRNLRQARWILASVLVCAVVASLYAVLTEDPAVAERLAGTYRNPNTLGIVAVVGMAICCAGIADVRRVRGVIGSYLVILVLAVGVLASSSLKGIAGTLFVLIATSFFARARAKMAVLAALGAAVVTALILTFEPVRLLWEHTLNRVEVTLTTLGTAADVGRSFVERSRFISKGLDLIAESPLVGTGLDTFRWLSDEGTYAHNNFVDVGVSLGLIGVVLYYGFHVSILSRAWRPGNRGRLVGRLALILVPMLILLDMASVSYATKLSALLLIACAGWLERPEAKADTRAEMSPQ